jgi:hypothetical protein
MNVYKNKKTIATALTFVMVMTLTGLPLAAKEQRGSMVRVTMTDGNIAKGELLSVKTDALLLYDQNARQGMSLDLQQVVQVNVLKKSKFGKGVIIGMGVGVGLSLLSNLINGPTSHHSGYGDALIGLLVVAPISGLCGGLIEASAGINKKFSLDKKFSMDGISSSEFQQNLEQLKRYARERDIKKPAGLQ